MTKKQLEKLKQDVNRLNVELRDRGIYLGVLKAELIQLEEKQYHLLNIIKDYEDVSHWVSRPWIDYKDMDKPIETSQDYTKKVGLYRENKLSLTSGNKRKV